MWCDSVVEFLYASCLKECLCSENLFLNCSVLPMYFFGLLSAVVAWYITFFCTHWPLRGHLSFLLFWQLQAFSSSSFLCFARIFWLWVWMMALRFLVQLYDIFTVFLLKSWRSMCFFGKCFETSAKNLFPNWVFPVHVFTPRLNGGLKYMMFLFFALLCFSASSGCLYFSS